MSKQASPREFARLAREQERGMKGKGGGGGGGGGGREQKETPIFPSTSTFDLPFLLFSLQLSRNNSIGNACFAGLLQRDYASPPWQTEEMTT